MPIFQFPLMQLSCNRSLATPICRMDSSRPLFSSLIELENQSETKHWEKHRGTPRGIPGETPTQSFVSTWMMTAPSIS